MVCMYLCRYFPWVYFPSPHDITLKDNRSCGPKLMQTYATPTLCPEQDFDGRFLVGPSAQPLELGDEAPAGDMLHISCWGYCAALAWLTTLSCM